MIAAALAHVVENRIEVAYARSDLFERRRVLMGDWARYLDHGPRKDLDSVDQGYPWMQAHRLIKVIPI